MHDHYYPNMVYASNSAERTASRNKTSFNCLHCAAYATHEWRALGYEEQDQYNGQEYFLLAEPTPAVDETLLSLPTADPWDTPGSMIVDSTWAQSECTGCKKPTTWRLNRVVYPTASPAPFPHPDMPDSVLPLYREARSVVNYSRRGAAALARATMELLLRELDPDAPKKARLDDRIARIEDKVSSGLGELLTFIRHVGNQSLHVTGAPDDAVVLVLNSDDSEPVEAIFEAINELVDELKTKPARNARLAGLVPASVRDDVERKRRSGLNPKAPTEQ